MIPMKAHRALDEELRYRQPDEYKWGPKKTPNESPVLDLSKFPAKKKLGDGVPANRIGLKIPRKTELGMGKSSSLQRVKSPQILRAPKPVRTNSSKMAGSMAFAHKARGKDDCQKKWTAAELQKLPSGGSKGKGRYGRLTSFEKDVMEHEEILYVIENMKHEGSDADELPEDDLWLADPKASVSSTDDSEHSWFMEHECEPPKVSFDDVDVDRTSDDSVGYEPPRMSMGGFYQDLQSPFVAEDMAARMAHKNVSNSGAMQRDTASCSSKASSHNSDLKRIGTVEEKLEFRYSTCSFDLKGDDLQQLDPRAWRAVQSCPIPSKAKVPTVYSLKGSQKGTDTAKSPVKHGPQRWAHRSFFDCSLDCPPAPAVCEAPMRHSSFEEDASQIAEPRVSCLSNCEASEIYRVSADSTAMEEDLGIVYRESTELPKRNRRRSSVGIARRVLGATLGVTTGAVMLVSGVIVARVFMGGGRRNTTDGSKQRCKSEEQSKEKHPKRIKAVKSDRGEELHQITA